MSLDVLLGLALFGLLFFGLAAASQWRGIPQRLWQHPATFSLAFLGATGVIFFFGSIELVGRYGVGGLIGIFAFSGLFILSPLFLEPIRWISRSHALATLPDMLVFRFRDPRVSVASSLLLATACLPMATAQFRVIIDLFPQRGDGQSTTALGLMAGLTLCAATFIHFFGQPRRATRAVPGVCASASLLAIVALGCTGLVAVYEVFGGIDALNQWAETSNQDQIIMRFDNAYALILLFFPLALILPQQGFLLTFSNWWPRHAPSGWIMPLLLMLVTLPVFPVLWAGLTLHLDAPLQLYYLSLPTALEHRWLSILIVVALLMAGLCLITVTAMAVGKLLVTSCLVKRDQAFGQSDLDHWLNRRRFAMATAWLAAVFVFSALNQSRSVADLTITAMIGVSQLLPGVIATLYMPKINARGFLAGLGTGCLLWIYGVVAPVFFNADPPQIFGMSIATGPENWPFWLLESLVANLLMALLVSLVTKTSDEEYRYAYQCMVDNLPAPQRQGLEIRPPEQIRRDLGKRIGGPAAAREMADAIAALDIDTGDLRPVTMRTLRDQLCFQLSAKLGTLTADHIIEQVMPSGEGPAVDDISLLESQIAAAGSGLSGLAAELNKLRLYHRRTLENLPIGVCSIDSQGEILLWNNTMANHTNVGKLRAEGANVADIESPWGDVLAAFRAAREDSWENREVRVDGRGKWFHFSKHSVEDHSPVYANYQIILMEDITEHIQLVRELSHAERLTSVGRLAAGVAHEIGNPVTGISCLAQDMIEESAEEETRDSARTILGLTERITSIVSTLINFSRRDQDIAVRALPLSSPVESAIKLLKLNKDAKAVEFRSTIPEDLMVRADPHQLTQVFVNLFANARDASGEGDLIEVSADVKAGEQVAIYVTDYGTGISRDNINRVMDPFFTTKDPGEGTGLGLSLVYSIMRTQGGGVTIDSPVAGGRGTRVTLTLDRA